MPLGSGNLLNPTCCTHARIFYVGVRNSKERALSLNHRLRHIVCRVKIAEDKCEKELDTSLLGIHILGSMGQICSDISR